MAINRILVCMETNGLSAVRLAARIARRNENAAVRLCSFLPDPPLYRSIAIPNYQELAELARSARQAQLEKVAARLRADGVKTECVTLHGRDECVIVREVERGGFDLLITAGDGAAQNFHASRLALFLMRNCPCPVLVARPGRMKRRVKVLAAIALEPEAAAALGERILSKAGELADVLGGALHVLHVWSAYGESMLRRSTFAAVGDAELAQYVDATYAQQNAALRALLDRCHDRIGDDCCHLVKGEPGEEIIRFCQLEGVDVVVLGTVARSGLVGALLGNTAERIAHTLPASVMAVRTGAGSESQ